MKFQATRNSQGNKEIFYFAVLLFVFSASLQQRNIPYVQREVKKWQDNYNDSTEDSQSVKFDLWSDMESYKIRITYCSFYKTLRGGKTDVGLVGQ